MESDRFVGTKVAIRHSESVFRPIQLKPEGRSVNGSLRCREALVTNHLKTRIISIGGKMRKFTFFLVAALVMFICQVAVQAQTTGSISGVVVDQNGAIVAGATVTVKNTGTGDERKTTSNGSGAYSVSQLNPGVYVVTVENKGFKKVVHSDVPVSVSVETKLDLALQIGLETETVTVTTGQDVINTSSPSLTN